MSGGREVEAFARLGEGYGRALAVIAAAGEAFNRAFAESFARTTEALKQPTDPEAIAVRRYRRRIAAERDAGLAHVRAESRRVRNELGLR